MHCHVCVLTGDWKSKKRGSVCCKTIAPIANRFVENEEEEMGKDGKDDMQMAQRQASTRSQTVV